MSKNILSLMSVILLVTNLIAQQPVYTKKYFTAIPDTTLRTNTTPPVNGFHRSYIITEPEIWDTDDNNTTHVRGGGYPVVIWIEGMYKDGKKNGRFSFTVIDSLDHKKKYRIWEQEYVNDQLNGEWKTYNLKGTLVKSEHFTNDSLDGLSTQFWIDGKRKMEEREYRRGSDEMVQRFYYDSGALELEQHKKGDALEGWAKQFYENGKLKQEVFLVKGTPEGPARKYYNDGTLEEETAFRNGSFDGIRKYYYPSGKLWSEQEYKEGKPWSAIANYDQNGNKREAGTLKNGNGTLLLYNEDGTVRETLRYENGKEQE